MTQQYGRRASFSDKSSRWREEMTVPLCDDVVVLYFLIILPNNQTLYLRRKIECCLSNRDVPSTKVRVKLRALHCSLSEFGLLNIAISSLMVKVFRPSEVFVLLQQKFR